MLCAEFALAVGQI